MNASCKSSTPGGTRPAENGRQEPGGAQPEEQEASGPSDEKIYQWFASQQPWNSEDAVRGDGRAIDGATGAASGGN